MAFHHTPVLPYDLDSRDARWPVDGGCFECVILIWVWVRTAKEDNHSPLWDKKFFLDFSFDGSQVVAAYIDRKRNGKQK